MSELPERASISPATSAPKSPSPSPSPNQGPYEWLRSTDIIFTVFQGEVPRMATWSVGTLMVFSFPDQTEAASRSIWYVALESRDPLNQSWHTIDLFERPWILEIEETSLTFMFDLGDVEAGNGQRYLVKTGCHESFAHILRHICYIKATTFGAVLDDQNVP